MKEVWKREERMRSRGKKGKWKGERRKTRISHLTLLSFGSRTIEATLFSRVN